MARALGAGASRATTKAADAAKAAKRGRDQVERRLRLDMCGELRVRAWRIAEAKSKQRLDLRRITSRGKEVWVSQSESDL